jgi:transposase
MDEKRESGSGGWREQRRLRAWELKGKGWKQKDIAEALGVSQGAVSRWVSAAEAGGVEALYTGPRKKRAGRLSAERLARLPELLRGGAESFGFRGAVWTRKRVAAVIKQEFGVSYTPMHVGRLLKAIRWSSQKPVERASQRKEAAIQQWRDETWPELKKEPSKKGGR